MTGTEIFSDEDLIAYLDSEADETLVAKIEAALSPELEHRLLTLEKGRERAVEGFEAALQMAPQMAPLPDATVGVGRFRPWGYAGLGLAASLFLAVGIYQTVIGAGARQVEPWHREVAAYHALYVTETLAAVPSDAGDQMARLADLSALVGGDLSPAMTSIDMQFRRAQQLGFEGAPLVQMAYLAEGGVPVALCILRSEGPRQEVRVTTIQGMSSASWADGTRRFLLIGGTDNDAAARRARDFASRLQKG